MKLLHLASDMAIDQDARIYYKTQDGTWGAAGVNGKPVELTNDDLEAYNLTPLDLSELEPEPEPGIHVEISALSDEEAVRLKQSLEATLRSRAG